MKNIINGNAKEKNMEIKIKVIKTEEEYKNALNLIEELMDKDPDPDSEEGEKLSLLTTLVKDYEANTFPETLPDPVDAILFRMEQQDLKPKDLIPYIGSRSKVSEILSRKRPLTLSMMRALETGLGIPAKVLLQEPDQLRESDGFVWSQFPVKEMEKRGYFGTQSITTSNIQILMEKFFQPVGSPAQFIGMLRKSYYVRSLRPMDKQALVAWSGYIVSKANKLSYTTTYKPGVVNLEFMQEVARLSSNAQGPIRAVNFLKEYGIALIIEPHFPQTYLDGATIITNKEHPVIGLTLRYDRLDNFWFTLMHELAHLSLHTDKDANQFYDDLDQADVSPNEMEADNLAGEALIPESKWVNSPARLVPSPIAAQSLARELKIHPAIVAGRMRHENQRYQYLNTIINQAKVRQYFPETRWEK
jgi:HTH-type transcriptional regulator/antitoxin HigA